MDPPHKEKKSLMRSACAWCVCARYIVHVLNSKSAVMFSCTLALGSGELLRQRGAVHEREELVGPRLAQPMPRGALRRLDRLTNVDSWSTGVWAVTEPDACAPSELRKFLQNQFSFFCGKCAICDFPSETGATPLPPFRNALRLEKNCELMRCSLRLSPTGQT